MRVQYCFRCRKVLPMLNEVEYAHFDHLYKQCSWKLVAYRDEHGKPPTGAVLDEMFRPMLDEFEQLTGRRDVSPKAILHRLSDYGPPCQQCGRPLRTPKARMCMECGHQRGTMFDRQRGCLLGLAVGDALGAAVEFMDPGDFQPVVGYRAGGPHRLAPGEWTDDTSMALALADSIALAGWDLNDQAARYVSWFRTGKYSVKGGCFDIGLTVRSAMTRFEESGDARTSGSTLEQSSGNGSIMRLAPVSIHFAHMFPDRIEDLVKYAAESSLPTHASEQCLSACRYFALVLAGLIHGLDREDVLRPDWEPLQRLRSTTPLHAAVDAVAGGSYRHKAPPQIVGSGYVVKSLEAALWAFHQAADFREATLRAVNLGNDADTTGAVCGQLAGACWGESGIPKDLLEGLARKDMIEAALGGIIGKS